MFDKGKCAWVTAVVDETTALEGIILAKSLSRIITIGKTIVLVSEDIPGDLGKTLAKFFDVVIPIDLRQKERETKLSKLELLKMFAWNLEMYAKLIVLSPNNMILKNCDDLFDFDSDILLSKKLNTTVFAIKPGFQIYKSLLKRVVSGQFHCLSDVFADFFGSNKNQFTKGELPLIYNVTLAEIAKNEQAIEEAVIISVCKEEVLRDVDLVGGEWTKAKMIIKDIWISHWNEVSSEMGPHMLPQFNNPSFLQSIEKSNYYKNSIAIVGYSCRFPGANNIEEFWELLKNRGDGICSIPTERLADHQLNDPSFTESKGGFLKCPIDEFDTKFFGISPREVVFMDPQQRLLMEVAWEALENAAIDPHSLKGSDTGLFTGVWTHDYEKLISANSSIHDFHHIVLGNAFSATSARVSYFLGLNGPNIATESGCSSSMVALHLACESLRKGETNLGLVMGSNIIVNIVPFKEIPLLAVDGHCKTYDENADGFGRAEGVAVIVLKRLSDAIKNGDRVMGIIRGSGISNEGTTSSFGTPSKLCQEIAVKEALKNANVEPGEVDYVEAHGTGTPVGDPIEFAALSSGYSGKREKPLIVGSVKTNIGHTESTAGLAGIIKVLLSMKHEIIPPHLNFKTLNPYINLSTVPSVIPVEAQPWRLDSNRVRKAGVSSFGISGTNVHVILEEAPVEKDFQPLKLNTMHADTGHYILTLSAKSKNALIELSNRYILFLDKNHGVDIRDLTFTANSGRAHMKHRLALIGSDVNEIKTKLENVEYSEPVLSEKPRIAFLFTGQGSQYFGMAKSLYECNFDFQKAFDSCAKIIETLMQINIKDALWNEYIPSVLEQTVYSQLSIFAVEFALVKFWRGLEVKPDYILGHSVGEFCAAVEAGILDLKDAIMLLAERSRLIQNLPMGGMLAVRSSKEKVSELISKFLKVQPNVWLDIAVINSSDEIVVAGYSSSIESFRHFCVNNGTQCQRLAASHAFHSRAMDDIMSEFGAFASTISFKSPSCPYISGTTGNLVLNGEMNNGEYWLRHAREPVNFLEGIKTLEKMGCTMFIEIGAHPVLLALGMSNLKNSEKFLWLPSLRRNTEDLKTLLGSLATLYKNGGDVNWANLYRHESRKKLELPSYPFQRQKYWFDTSTENVGKQIHPLLGKRMLLAGVQDTVYTGKWNLRDLEYLKDHTVANVIILPGAGFLEILIAAGKDVLGNDADSKGMKIENFVVEAPLELEEEKTYHTQVVASAIDKEDNRCHIKVYVYKTVNNYSDEKGWKIYASGYAKFNDTKHFEGEANMSLNYSAENFTDIKFRCKTESSSKQFYEKIQNIGLSFGESFCSIETLWRGENEILTSIPLPRKAGTVTDYVYHPIVLDAMLQTMGFSAADLKTGLHLPVGIDHVYLISEDLTELVFAHAKWDAGAKTGTVALYNSKNDLLALIVGLRLLRTSVSTFINGINSQKHILPDIYQEVWRTRLGYLQARVDLQKIDLSDAFVQSKEKSFYIKNICDAETLQKFSSFVSLLILKMLVFNGIRPNVGHIYYTRGVMQDNLISLAHEKFFHRLIEILIEDEYLVCVERKDSITLSWKAMKAFPNVDTIMRNIDDFFTGIESRYRNNVTMCITLKCMDHLWGVLQGKQTPVAALFGRDDLNPLDVYTKGTETNMANTRAANFIDLAFRDLKAEGKQDGNILRIIEIGAGSASTSIAIIKQLQKSNIPFRYTFTDISAHFFENAKLRISYSGMEYKLLDIEKDPCQQGFCPHQYDIVIAANVIHATEILTNSVKNIRKLLRIGGILVLEEMLTPFRGIDIIFGILEGYWKFTDYNIRPSHAMVGKNVWDSLFAENSFNKSTLLSPIEDCVSVLVTKAVDIEIEDCGITDCASNFPKGDIELKSVWLIFCDNGELHKYISKEFSAATSETIVLLKNENVAQSIEVSEKVILFDLGDSKQLSTTCDKLLATYKVKGVIYLTPLNYVDSFSKLGIETLNFCQYFTAHIQQELIFLFITRGVYLQQNQENVRPVNSLVWGMIKSLMNESKVIGKIIDLDPDVYDPIIESKEIVCEVFDNEQFVSLRNRKRLVPRIIKLPKCFPPLNVPKGRYIIDIPSSKKINDVTFRCMEKQILGSHDIEIVVKAVALNFRDIFVILKPDKFQTMAETVGTDYSGVVSNIGSHVSKYKIGDEVYGATTTTSCVASHIVMSESTVLPMPKNFTFAEAATVPTVYSTSYYSLVTVAKLQRGETILIHVASGGVGLSAIQIAQDIGAKIIATAGSMRKRAYLKSLGIEHVFHSRDLSYGEEIKKVTHGKGVNVVLNSLTGVGFKETTLEICAEGARFLEIGKVNIWQENDVVLRRPDVKYTIVNLETVDKEEFANLLGTIVQAIGNKYKAITYTRFEAANIVEALNYLMKSQHIGKVLITMPEIFGGNNERCSRSGVFSKNATYLITGGLGGIGLEVAKWMADSGAKNLVLVGRTPPKSIATEAIVKMRGNGCKIFSFQVDVGDLMQCETLFERIKSSELKLPPLKGVIHSAGVISDATYANQTWEKYKIVLNAKVNGTLNLHNLTKDLNLEHFVLFSSISGVIGSMGQSNHAAANAFLDSFAHYRHSIGLRAQTINWGAWSEVGVAANLAIGVEGIFGVKPFTLNQGIAALKFAMSHPNLLQLCVIQLDIDLFKQSFGGFVNAYLSELTGENKSKALNISASAQSEVFWSNIISLSLEERVEHIKGLLSNIIRQTLRIPESEQIDEYQSFSEMGLDSLMAVEIRNKLQNIIGQKATLNVSALMDFPTVSGLSKYLADVTISLGVITTNVEIRNTDKEIDIYELIKQDSVLPKDIQAKSKCVKASEVRSILITGATGHFGSYLLTELVKNTSLDIYCLVRGKSVEQCRKKLLRSVRKFCLLDFIDIDRIAIIVGDVAKDHLGVSVEEYSILSEKVDAVYHLAAKINHVEKYQINSSKNTDIRSVNVIGTVNILKLAANIKTKRVFYPSSFTTVNRLTKDGFAYEDFPDDDNNADQITMGYSISKFVGEKLMKQAIDIGIPVTVVRYSSLAGHSETGQFIANTNFAFNALLLFLNLGIAPNLEGGLHFLPIDIASKLTIELLFHDDVQSGLINLFHPSPLYIPEFVDIALKFGHNIKLVTQDEFFQKIEQDRKSSIWLSLFESKTDFQFEFSNLSLMTARLTKEKKSMYQLSQKCLNSIPNFIHRIPSVQLIAEKFIEYSDSNGILNDYSVRNNKSKQGDT